ncbi:MAG: HD-GYP domain-containing protein [Thiohalomonadales bacterium]
MAMYIAELDKPWIESPFLFQGFPVNTDEEIEQLRELCDYVYVDTERTPFDVRPSLNVLNKIASKQPNIPIESEKSDNEEFSNYKKQLIYAKKLRDKTRDYIDHVLDDVRMGKSVNTKDARIIVTNLVDSIVSSPDASMWLTHLKKRDEYTAIHSVNVCILTITFGRAIGVDKKDLINLGLGALLHDIGKMKTPLEILNKEGKLTKDEFTIMMRHPYEGYSVLKEDKNMSPESLEIILSHHERLDGSGYPGNITEVKITYFTRIVSIVDVYDAITSDRVYHDGISPHDALNKLFQWMPGKYDKELMEKFIKTIGIYPIGSIVELKSGHVGMVAKFDEKNKLRPVIMLLLDKNKKSYSQRKMINTSNPMWRKKNYSVEIKRIVEAKEYGINVNAILLGESKSDI